MLFDLKKIERNTFDTIGDPTSLFRSLPNSHYKYLRDVQAEVLKKWYSDFRDKKDSILKMNTGSGKTIVSLLILKSSLNENKGPAVYIAPDNILVEQAYQESIKLGIKATKQIEDIDFKKGKAILIISINHLFNGMTKFKIGNNSEYIKIGTLLFDDVHACINIVEQYFTINILRKESIYEEIFGIFKNDLSLQNPNKLHDIINKNSNESMLVPFWSWKSNYNSIYKILSAHATDGNLKFNFPLLKEKFELCDCVINTNSIEISNKQIPVNIIPSFTNANRRIFLSATLKDDSVLISHFNINPESSKYAITPEVASDIGERMILVPQDINNEISDEEIRNYIFEQSKNFNVVVLVPSYYQASLWNKYTDKIISKSEDFLNVTKELKVQKKGLVIFINKYDGIDLPDEACRILVIDGIPETRSLKDKIKQGILMNSKEVLIQNIQKIEQGMGRGVRAPEDYCVVFLMNRKLLDTLFVENNISNFSNATRKQFEISEQISSQIKESNGTLAEINEAASLCLNRKQEWISLIKGELAQINYDNRLNFSQISISLRRAFEEVYRFHNYNEAVYILENFSKTDNIDSKTKGWILQKKAEYLDFIDPIQAQNALVASLKHSLSALVPKEGIKYKKLDEAFNDQILNCSDVLNKKYSTSMNNYMTSIYSIIEDLKFLKDTSNKFEEAVKNLGIHLGFIAQRPEFEAGAGPDNLWGVGNQTYFVIECKNEITSEKEINKHDCNQLNGSIKWCEKEYNNIGIKIVPILIHPNIVYGHICSPDKTTRIINEEKLELIKYKLLEFSKALAKNGNFNDIAKIKDLLIYYKFSANKFIEEYTYPYKIKK